MLELALHVLDICENAIRAGATRIDITLQEDTNANALTIEIVDNGSGMDPDVRSRALDPFFTTKQGKRIGLGIPLLAQAAEAAGGWVCVLDAPSGGTRVVALFELDHPDRQPVGDIGGVVAMLLSRTDTLDIRCTYYAHGEKFVFDSAHLRAELEGLWTEHPAVIRFIRDSIRSGIDRCNAANHRS